MNVNNYMTLLKEKNLTVTPQRLELVNLLSSHGHLNIDDLYKSLSASFPSISLATVYKNVNTMLEKNFLMEVQIPNKKNVYELMKEEHVHVSCSRCGEILDVNLSTEGILKEAEQKSDFKLNFASVTFDGTCVKCQA